MLTFELLSQTEGYQPVTNQILSNVCSHTHVLHYLFANIYTSRIIQTVLLMSVSARRLSF